MDDYETLLEHAQSKIPKAIHTQGRFEIPKVVGHFEGNKTIRAKSRFNIFFSYSI